MNRNGIGTEPVLILRVLPDFGPGNVDLLRGIGVGHGVAVLHIAADYRLVPLHVHIDFLQRILDLDTFFVILIDLRESADPVSFFGQLDHGVVPVVILRDLAVPHQYDGHALRTFPVLIIRVLPVLDDRHAGLARIQRVGYVAASVLTESIDGIVIIQLILCDQIRDLMSAGIDGHILKRPRPAVGSGYLLGIHHCRPVGVELDRNALRPGVIAVVIVHPGLAAEDCACLRRITVCRIQSTGCLLVNIQIHSGVNHGVLDLDAAVPVFAHIKGPGPLVCPVGLHHELPGFQGAAIRILSEQLNGDLLRPFPVLIACVIPGDRA